MSAPRAILFAHQNFPGQFPAIAAALVARGDTVKAIAAPTAPGMAGVDVRHWTLSQGSGARRSTSRRCGRAPG